jgi:hypothetical protein
MGVVMESDFDYVRRKLQNPIYNIGAIANQLGIQRYRLDKIIKGGDAKFSLIETLRIYFKDSAA